MMDRADRALICVNFRDPLGAPRIIHGNTNLATAVACASPPQRKMARVEMMCQGETRILRYRSRSSDWPVSRSAYLDL